MLKKSGLYLLDPLQSLPIFLKLGYRYIHDSKKGISQIVQICCYICKFQNHLTLAPFSTKILCNSFTSTSCTLTEVFLANAIAEPAA